MAFTLVAFTESQDSATLTNVAALADPHIRVSGDDITVPRGYNRVIAVYALGPNTTRAQLVSPSLRRFINYEIVPIDVAAEPSSPAPVHDLRDNPLVLDEDESLNAQAAEDAAGAARTTVLVWLSSGQLEQASGEIRTVRATSSTTLTANAWTNGSLTFDQALPAGRYAIVGARGESAGLIAFRFVFVGGIWRPGAIGADARGDLGHRMFRNGALGVWGEFSHNTPPTVDFLSASADTSEVVDIDLVRLGS